MSVVKLQHFVYCSICILHCKLYIIHLVTFRDSSMVEQVAVNDKVLGSSPSRGARHKSAPGFAKDRCRMVSVNIW